jgi:hypothetical protein
MATLKEKLDGLTDDQRNELREALGVKPTKKDDGDEDVVSTITKIIERVTALEKKGKEKPKKDVSWWDSFWNGIE